MEHHVDIDFFYLHFSFFMVIDIDIDIECILTYTTDIGGSFIGKTFYVTECIAGILKPTCSRAVPFWWDNVLDF